jgi:hypothetical protein
MRARRQICQRNSTGHRKRVNIYESIDGLSLHIITKSLAKPSIACVIWRDLAAGDYAYSDIPKEAKVVPAGLANRTLFI